MRHTDIAVVGGGLAGSLAAATLGRAGVACILVDPDPVYPPDYRVEKIGAAQLAMLAKTGLADTVLRATAPIAARWIARFGRLVEKMPNNQHGIMYDLLVNTLRGAIPPSVVFIPAKATGISTSADRQHITLSNGEEISARLIVLATGLNHSLRNTLGIVREVLSRQHSLSVGFDVRPVGRANFAFPALDYYAERTSDRTAYLTLFPVRGAMRANLFMYRDPRDPWLRELRAAPQASLYALMPRLENLMGNFEVTSEIAVRPADLYITSGYCQDGVVLAGDAFGTSCPVAGTGANKVFTDVERLCNVHIPAWLGSPGMGVDKISSFYEDPVKRAIDADSLARAWFMRSVSLDDGLVWRLRRWHRFLGRLAHGMMHAVRRGLAKALRPGPKIRPDRAPARQSMARAGSDPAFNGAVRPRITPGGTISGMVMRKTSLVAAILAIVPLLIAAPAHAAELRVAGGGNFQKAGPPLAAAFNARMGGSAIYTTGNTGGTGMPQRLAAGEVMDVIVMPEGQVRGREQAGLIKPGTAVSFARYRMGVGVRKGAAKPDVSTREKLRAVLLAAKTVSIPEPDPAQNSGMHMRKILLDLGIYDEVMKKAIMLESRPVGAVVEGKAELSVSPLPELMEEAQAEVAGPVPADLGGYTTFAIAVVASAKNDADARAFIRFVTSPEGAAVWKQNGLEALPGAP